MIARRFAPVLLAALALLTAFGQRPTRAAGKTRHLLYVASPGIRNYVEYGGVGILVFDMDDGFRFVRRIPTLPVVPGKEAENVKGVCASAKTGRLYMSTPQRLLCIDLLTDAKLWERTYPGGCDRMSISPDGKVVYVPSFEGPTWNVVDGRTGDVIKTIETNSGAHNTVYAPDGRHVYLGGLKSPVLNVADTHTHTISARLGPFGNVIRPFTINGAETRCYVNVNDLLGFEIGDLKTGKVLQRVQVEGYAPGEVKRHSCPSHGIGLTPDEKEIWLSDGHNDRMHIFDNTQWPPKQVATLKLREQPGWVTFSIDGRYAIPSTGEVFEVKSRKLVTALADERGQPVHSEKLMEIDFEGGRPIHVGDQFGIGRRR